MQLTKFNLDLTCKKFTDNNVRLELPEISCSGSMASQMTLFVTIINGLTAKIKILVK